MDNRSGSLDTGARGHSTWCRLESCKTERSFQVTPASKQLINTETFSDDLRRRGIDIPTQRVLITKFAGSTQAEDLTLPPNCGGFGRIHHFHRDQGPGWPANPLPIDVVANFFHSAPCDSIQVQVFQNAICSWRCWYCFVDYDLLSGNR